MRFPVPHALKLFAEALPRPLYLVGGSVRDFLAGVPLTHADWDICSPATEEEALAAAGQTGLRVRAVYRNTGTVRLQDAEGTEYEYTRFRSDTYVRGIHTPVAIDFTDDIVRDALRRDFRANAVYFDIAAGQLCDPLDGVRDIRAKVLRTVAPAEKVFGEDGLRLVRLARQTAQTGFSPDEACIAGAARNAALIRDIAPERIFREMELLLHADARADANGPYRGLHVLQKTGVLKELLPELAAGEGMAQRADFHNYDVLEHSLRCVLYSPPSVRWAALLHDAGKPLCFLRDGNFHAHPQEGARIAQDVLSRLKAPKKLISFTARLVALHMRDFNLQMKESKVRREIVADYALLPALFALRQADFSACKDDLSPAPGVVKWQRILQRMRGEGVPFSLKELAVNGSDLAALGIRGERTGEVLGELLAYCIQDGRRNTRAALVKHIRTLERNQP